MTDENKSGEGDKLFAGKFKTVAELEDGYKHSLPVFQENQTLKQKLEEISKIPDDYSTPAGIALHETDLAEVKRLAKNSGLTQAQYEKLALETNAKSTAKYNSFEDAKKEIGADNLNILQDFIKKQYPEKVSDTILRNAITNKDIRAEILNQRQLALNSGAPGIGKVSGGLSHSVTYDDVLKARDTMNKLSGKEKVAARNKYINLQSALAHQAK